VRVRTNRTIGGRPGGGGGIGRRTITVRIPASPLSDGCITVALGEKRCLRFSASATRQSLLFESEMARVAIRL
jgi:hypothetical protein